MSDYKGTTRSDINKIATELETLAKELQTRLASSGDVLAIGSELVRNTTTLVFSLGELYHAEHATTSSVAVKQVTAPAAGKTAVKNLNYHNKRDANGRFVS